MGESTIEEIQALLSRAWAAAPNAVNGHLLTGLSPQGPDASSPA